MVVAKRGKPLGLTGSAFTMRERACPAAQAQIKVNEWRTQGLDTPAFNNEVSYNTKADDPFSRN